MNAVVIVESPAKAKTINKYLGKDYQVLASYGHVRDLPAKDGSVGRTKSFAMSWTVDAKADKRSRKSPGRSRAPTSSTWRPIRTARARPSPGTSPRS